MYCNFTEQIEEGQAQFWFLFEFGCISHPGRWLWWLAFILLLIPLRASQSWSGKINSRWHSITLLIIKEALFLSCSSSNKTFFLGSDSSPSQSIWLSLTEVLLCNCVTQILLLDSFPGWVAIVSKVYPFLTYSSYMGTASAIIPSSVLIRGSFEFDWWLVGWVSFLSPVKFPSSVLSPKSRDYQVSFWLSAQSNCADPVRKYGTVVKSSLYTTWNWGETYPVLGLRIKSTLGVCARKRPT